jgi:hypothetical protein
MARLELSDRSSSDDWGEKPVEEIRGITEAITALPHHESLTDLDVSKLFHFWRSFEHLFPFMVSFFFFLVICI